MPARKRSRTSASASGASSAAITLTGGEPEKQRTIDKYENGMHTDVELRAGDGTAFHAHALCLMAGSAYMERLYSGGWSDVGDQYQLPQSACRALDCVGEVWRFCRAFPGGGLARERRIA